VAEASGKRREYCCGPWTLLRRYIQILNYYSTKQIRFDHPEFNAQHTPLNYQQPSTSTKDSPTKLLQALEERLHH
jgi:hypothetical protein